MVKPLSEEDEYLYLRRFSDYHAYLISDDDPRWDLYSGKNVYSEVVLKELFKELLKPDPISGMPQMVIPASQITKLFGPLTK